MKWEKWWKNCESKFESIWKITLHCTIVMFARTVYVNVFIRLIKQMLSEFIRLIEYFSYECLVEFRYRSNYFTVCIMTVQIIESDAFFLELIVQFIFNAWHAMIMKCKNSSAHSYGNDMPLLPVPIELHCIGIMHFNLENCSNIAWYPFSSPYTFLFAFCTVHGCPFPWWHKRKWSALKGRWNESGEIWAHVLVTCHLKVKQHFWCWLCYVISRSIKSDWTELFFLHMP